MANYNVDIELAVKRSSQLNAELKKLNNDLDKLVRKAKSLTLGATGVKGAERQRLKAEQDALKVRAESLGVVKATSRELARQAKIVDTISKVRSVRIARIANERAKGLGQFASPIGPQQDRTAEIRKQAQQQRLQLATKSAFQTKLELALAQRLIGVEGQITKQQQTQIKSQQSLNRQKEKALALTKREAAVAQKAAAKKKSNKGLSNLALGVGFPLLFGGGVGSVAGGALGSVGGMGGQVLGSAIGGIVDQAVASVAKLGQALNPLTADIGAVTAAAGESGTSFEQLTGELEEAVGKEKALAVATEQLATIIGQDGVDALQEFGEETTILGNEFAKTLSQISAAVAALIGNSGLLTAVAGRMEFTRLVNKAEQSKDPTIVGLRQERKDKPTLTLSINERIAARQKELDLAEQLKISERATTAIAKKREILTRAELAVRDADYKVIQLGGSLLKEKAYQAARSVVFANTALAVKKAENDTSRIALIMADEKNKLEELRVRKSQQIAAKAKSTAKSGVATGRKAQRDADRAEKERLRSLKSGEKLILGLEKQLAINSSSFEFTKEFAAADFEREALQLRINDLLDEEQRKTAAILADRQAAMAGAGIFADMGDPSEMIGFDQAVVAGQTLQLLEQEEALEKVLEKYPMIGEAATAAAGLVTFGVQEMIDGTKSAEQVFADFLNSIAEMLMKTAQQMIAQYIAMGIARMFAGFNPSSFSSFSGSMSGGNPFTPGGSMPFTMAPPSFGGFADGGRPPVGRPSIVGERGPELFVPGASGTIIPNHAMGGANVTVNVDASGSSVEGDGDQAAQLGKAIGIAVQQELVKQKRPGGLLAR